MEHSIEIQIEAWKMIKSKKKMSRQQGICGWLEWKVVKTSVYGLSSANSHYSIDYLYTNLCLLSIIRDKYALLIFIN